MKRFAMLLLFAVAPILAGLPGEKTQGDISFAYYQVSMPQGIPTISQTRPITQFWIRSSDSDTAAFRVTARYSENGKAHSVSVTVERANTQYTLTAIPVSRESITSVIVEELKPCNSEEFNGLE